MARWLMWDFSFTFFFFLGNVFNPKEQKENIFHSVVSQGFYTDCKKLKIQGKL